MTENEAKARLCLWAESQLGYHEGANNHNKYADNPDLQRMYGWTPQNQPWCDVFVDSGFIQCFGLEAACAMTYQPMGAGSALCKQSAQYYKDNGAWTNRPEIGDQVFFYASGDINHTGIVIRVAGGSVVTVEGNSSDMVAERVYSVSDSKIAGYGRPKWSVVADGLPQSAAPTAPPEEEPSANEQRYYELRLPYLRRGSTGAAVCKVQFQLMGQGYNIGPDGADGDYGYNSEEAIKEFQLNVGLTPDGVVGSETGAALYGGEVVTVEAEIVDDVQSEPLKPPGFWNSLLTKFKRG